jgi:SNF2 family DNA or RNA helicase
MSAYNLFSNFSHFTQNHEFNIVIDELTEDHPKAEQPQNVNLALKTHQLTLLYRCIEYENRNIKLDEFSSLRPHAMETDEFKTRIGVIADRVGSGKSFVVLSIIMSNNIMTKDTTIVKSCGMNNVAYFFKDTKPVVKTNMLVIPHNLCSQWDSYIQTFSPNLNYKVINKQKIIDTIIENNVDLTQLDLIVVTATFFNRVSYMIVEKNVKLQRIFFDEVDNLNIPGCSTINAGFYWFITASYGNLLYPRGFTKYDSALGRHHMCAMGIRNSGLIKNIFLDLFTHIPRSFMKVLIIKNSDAYIETSISLPEIITNIIKSKTPHSINILNGIVDKNIIECLNAGDVERAIGHISPNNKRTEENIITMMIEKYNKQLVNYNLRLTMANEFVYDNEEDRQADINNINNKIKEIKNKITLITERIHNNDICSICYDDIEKKTVTNCCQNSFCFKCIHIWLSKKAVCPLCKTKMLNTDVYVISSGNNTNMILEEETIDENEFNEKFDKWRNFEILLKKKPRAKMLIFSNYDNTFTNIIPILNTNNIKWDFIKGNGNQIAATVRRYKGTELDVLLVNTRHYATGMNLENTSDIVMFHKHDSQQEQQIIGRAHRYGRIDPLNVHYLLYENEIRV